MVNVGPIQTGRVVGEIEHTFNDGGAKVLFYSIALTGNRIKEMPVQDGCYALDGTLAFRL